MSLTYTTPSKILEKYGIEPSKIYWWIRTDKITYVKIGKSVLIPEQEFLKFLEENTRKPLSEENFFIPEKLL